MKTYLLLITLLALTACNGSDSSVPTVNGLSGSTLTSTNTTGGIVTGSTSTNVGSSSSSSSDSSSGSSGTASTGSTSTSTAGVALVFSGNGACTDGCVTAAQTVAVLAGLTVKNVTGNELTTSSTPAQIAAFFAGAKVWIMPGGVANDEVNALSSTMISALKSFVSGGGGYVGFCAGAFSATTQIGTTGQTGLGLFPGSTIWFDPGKSVQDSYGGSIQLVTWDTTTRYVYLEGGPYLANLPSTVDVVSRYSDNSVAAAKTSYGSGRVFLSGFHPEAPTWWYAGTNISDPDGSDVSLAAEMIKWAASLD